MSDIVKMYLYRLVRDKTFWICVAIGVAVSLLTTVVYGVSAAMLKNDATYTPSTIFTQSLSALTFTNLPSLFGPAICCFFLTREFHDGTIRNMILAGKKRLDIYLSAIVIALIICYFNVLVDEAFIWGFGYAFGLSSGLTDAVAVERMFVSVGIMFIISLMFVSVTVGLCFLVPNAFGSFGIYIGFVFALSLIYLLASVIIAALMQSSGLSAAAGVDWLELSSIDQIYYLESYPSLSGFLDGTRIGWIALKAFLETVIFGGLAVFFGGFHFVRSDLK